MDNQYNLNLQIGGLFAVLASSVLGVGFALTVHHIARSKAAILTVVLFKGIGVGVIVCTACIHLINEAYDGFENNPLLPGDYDAWPFVFALAAIWIMACVDFFLGRNLIDRTKANKDFDPKSLLFLDDHCTAHTHKNNQESAENPNIHSNAFDGDNLLIGNDNGYNGSANKLEMKKEMQTNLESKSLYADTENQDQQRVYIAEASILIHSLMIGIDLGVQYEQEYTSLLVAIVFHQFFEGFGLGQMVQNARFEKLKVVLMASFFALTTPIGIAIGIGIHKNFNEDTESNGARLTIGILNSLCGGILLYLGLVNLLTSWFTENKDLLIAPVEFGMFGLTGILLGFACMAIIGIWA